MSNFRRRPTSPSPSTTPGLLAISTTINAPTEARDSQSSSPSVDDFQAPSPRDGSSVVDGDSDSVKNETTSSQDSSTDADPSIVEALRSKDRLFVLKLGEQMERLLMERLPQIDVLPSTSYQRLLVHRCAAYYKLRPENDPTSKGLIVTATIESKVPCRRLCDLVPVEPPPQPAFKIMRRASRERFRSKPHSQAGSVTGDDADFSDIEASENGSLGGRSNMTGTSKKHMTIEEREAAYNEARSRIFMDFEEKEKKEKDMSASSSTRSLVSGSASTSGGGETSSVGDMDDSVSTAATESEWSGPATTQKREGRRGANSASSSRSLRSSARGSRATSPSFTFPTLYEPTPATGLDASQVPPPPGYIAHYVYPYHPAQGQTSPQGYLAPYGYYPPFSYQQHPHPQAYPMSHSDPTSPAGPEMYAHQHQHPPPQPLPYPNPNPYMWPQQQPPPTNIHHPQPPNPHQGSQPPSSQPNPMGHPSLQNSPYPPQNTSHFPPPYGPTSPNPYNPYTIPYYPPHPPHPQAGMPPIPTHMQGQPMFTVEGQVPFPSSLPNNSNRVNSAGNMNGSNNHSRTSSRNSNGGNNGVVASGRGRGALPNGRPPNGHAWTYGPGIGFGYGGASSGGETVGPRLSSSMRRTSGTSSGSASTGNRTPGDEASSTASSSTSSSSRRTYTSTSTTSKHPLPARPDWAVGLKPQHHRHHDHSTNGSSPISPARNGVQSQPNQNTPSSLQATDFPPLSTMSPPPKQPTASGAWTNPSSTRLILQPGPGQAVPSGSYASALVQPPSAHGQATNTSPRLDEGDRGFERPPPKSSAELFNPKGALRRPNSNSSGKGSPQIHEKGEKERARGEAIASAILVEKVAAMSLEGGDGFRNGTEGVPAVMMESFGGGSGLAT
ncbi:hypothetical protein JAAARDRAFT_30816 [Jaapia argillacea MUCL 33604]|uniref:SUZ domain-containing protein n=1 Tax=Jaapia argillacea MUCL 33604 TaxID=933084 RepID=A0A067Q324_9AGAM|nr:hypothetical protein JAAARDRAFT_30816 [Jaapia argillacea MUCL 33604]